LIQTYNPYAVRLPPVGDDSGFIKVSPGGLIPKDNLPRADVRLRPMGMTRQELEQLVSTKLYRPGLTEEEAASREQKYQEELEKFQKDLRAVSEKATLLQHRLEGKAEPFETGKIERKPAMMRPFDTELLKREAKVDEKVDVYEQMQADIDRLATLEKEAKQEQPVEKEIKTEKQMSAEKKDVEPKPVKAEKLSEVMLASARARSILGEHKSFASYSDDKFNSYVRAAEEHMKAGKFYRAADLYTLAIMYKSDDPLGFAGKSNALFAAGEYVSSALFLKRAIEMFPEYVYFKIDIESMLGDRDKLDARIADLREWLKTSGRAPELAFLLSYIYYQLDLAEPAKENIDIAYNGMAEEPAVLCLKKAIEQLAAQQIK
jgi:tetratricopeptide (TPR) repeat protein